LKQQREPATRPSPRRGDLAHPALRTDHSRHSSVQERAVLEEVEMPPRLVLRVVNPATLAPALRARKPAPTRKIHVQIKPAILDRKLAARHHPRRLQPKGQLEKIGVSHPLTIDSIPTNRSQCKPKKQPYPLNSARSLTLPRLRRIDRKRGRYDPAHVGPGRQFHANSGRSAGATSLNAFDGKEDPCADISTSLMFG